MSPKPKLVVTGDAGAAPPPGAPHEVTQPLQPEAIADHLAKAQVNEKQLQPLKFPAAKPISPKPATVTIPILLPHASLKPSTFVPDPPPPQETPAPPPPTVSEVVDSTPLAVHQPAASNTDTPSKGIPKPIADPGKQITGGWGDSAPQYFALDGSELRAIILSLMEDLKAKMGHDLRFHLAITYPQVRARVIVQVDGADASASVNDSKFDLASAQILLLTAQVADTNDTPADLLRDDTGLKKPQKHLVKTGGGKTFADVDL